MVKNGHNRTCGASEMLIVAKRIKFLHKGLELAGVFVSGSKVNVTQVKSQNSYYAVFRRAKSGLVRRAVLFIPSLRSLDLRRG